MINQSTMERLRSMKLGAIATELDNQLKAPQTYGTLGFENVSHL